VWGRGSPAGLQLYHDGAEGTVGTSLNEASFSGGKQRKRMTHRTQSVNSELVYGSQPCHAGDLPFPHRLFSLHPIVLAPQQPDYALIASCTCRKHCLFHKLRHNCLHRPTVSSLYQTLTAARATGTAAELTTSAADTGRFVSLRSTHRSLLKVPHG